MGIIDGHLQLMRLDARMPSWECFIRNQFLKPIYDMYSFGCPRVVLCFDDYANVPLYKAMTQNSRVNKVTTGTSKKKKTKDEEEEEEDEEEDTESSRLKEEKIKLIKAFGPHDALPPVIPDEPMLYLMNRHFKLKVIDLVCQRVPQMLRMSQKEHEFILDYKKVVLYHPIIVHHHSDQHPPATKVPLGSILAAEAVKAAMEDQLKVTVVSDGGDSSKKRKFAGTEGGSFPLIPCPILMKDMVSMGESDVKFVRYVKKYGNALVHAIDGDYMAIALLYYSTHGIHENNKIHIYRQFSVLNTGKGKEDAATSKPKEEMTTKKKSAAEKKCWVDMQLLFTVISHAMRQSGSSKAISTQTFATFSDEDSVFTAVFLMLCAGTDFSRNLPLIGAKRIWDCLPDIAVPAIQALKGGSQLNETMFMNLVAGKLYGLIYCNHLTCPPSVPFERILASLKASKLSQGTKNKFPSSQRLQNTIKNLNWVTKYWMMDNGHVETPLNGEYGYAKDSNGNMNFVDLIHTTAAA